MLDGVVHLDDTELFDPNVVEAASDVGSEVDVTVVAEDVDVRGRENVLDVDSVSEEVEEWTTELDNVDVGCDVPLLVDAAVLVTVGSVIFMTRWTVGMLCVVLAAVLSGTVVAVTSAVVKILSVAVPAVEYGVVWDATLPVVGLISVVRFPVVCVGVWEELLTDGVSADVTSVELPETSWVSFVVFTVVVGNEVEEGRAELDESKVER